MKLRVTLAIVATILCGRAFAIDYPTCPALPQPIAWNGKPSLQLHRDIETCRVFGVYQMNEPFGIVLNQWREYDQTSLDSLVKRDGYRVEVTDRLLAGTPTRVTEFLNTGLNHYFLALPDEARAIEQVNAGAGWKSTGYGFIARTITYEPLPGMRSPINFAYVHRFYGSVTPGPNSHFFTADSGELHFLVELAKSTPVDKPRWNHEGLAFFGSARKTELGECPAGSVPVWRAFNGGALRGVDPNHRFSTDKMLIDGMTQQGWVPEGIAFCVDHSE